MITRLFAKFASTYRSATILINRASPEHCYRILSIEHDNNNNYIAVIQVAKKGVVFRMKPEEILASDTLTDAFSQRDIRTLTYLGYLGINSPKYKILAKRLAENDAHLIFAIQERGKKKPLIKTASEISNDQSLIAGLHQIDAHMIGYATATAQTAIENQQKKLLQK